MRDGDDTTAHAAWPHSGAWVIIGITTAAPPGAPRTCRRPGNLPELFIRIPALHLYYEGPQMHGCTSAWGTSFT